MTQNLICRTCLNIKSNKYLDLNRVGDIGCPEYLGEVLEECVSEVCLQFTRDPLICEECHNMLISTYCFKRTFSKTEEQIYKYIKFHNLEVEKHSNINLMDVVKFHNGPGTQEHGQYETTAVKIEISAEENILETVATNLDEFMCKMICRTCLKIIEGHNYIPLNRKTDLEGHIMLGSIFEDCISSTCLQLTQGHVVCEDCNKLLINSYFFKKLCCETEEKLYNYMNLHNLNFEKNVELNLRNIVNAQNSCKKEIENNCQQSQNYCSEQTHNSCNKLAQNDPNTSIENNCTKKKIYSKKRKRNNSIIDSVQPNINIERPKRMASRNAATKILQISAQIVDSSPTLSDSESLCSNFSMSSRTGTNSNIHIHVSANVLKKKKTTKQISQKPVSSSRSFKCSKCHYKAFRNDLLIRHKEVCKNRHKNREKIYNKICKFCSKRFDRKYHLERHLYTHTKHSNHICEKCGQQFAEGYQLKTHMLKHIQSKGMYKCYHCPKTFFRKCDLTSHVKKTVLKEKNYACSYCNEEFRESRGRKSHVSKCHTGEKLPFACKKCSFNTAYASRLKKHMVSCW